MWYIRVNDCTATAIYIQLLIYRFWLRQLYPFFVENLKVLITIVTYMVISKNNCDLIDIIPLRNEQRIFFPYIFKVGNLRNIANTLVIPRGVSKVLLKNERRKYIHSYEIIFRLIPSFNTCAICSFHLLHCLVTIFLCSNADCCWLFFFFQYNFLNLKYYCDEIWTPNTGNFTELRNSQFNKKNCSVFWGFKKL